MYLPKSSAVAKYIRDEAQSAFAKDLVDCDKRISVLADLETFKHGEDYGVWKQYKGDLPHVYSVYFDGVFLFSFPDIWTKPFIIREFWVTFKKHIEDEKIFLDETEYTRREEAKKQADKELEDQINKLSESTEVESIAKEVIKKVHKQKRDKRKANGNI